MKKISPENFTETLKEVCGDNLCSVVLYGSAAAGDYKDKGSDYNLLVMLNDLHPATLRSLAKPVAAWEKAGNPPPLLFTGKRLSEAADVFPIELLDMRDARKVLFGEDVIQGLEIGTDNLRLQVERELRSALIQLRRGGLSALDKPRMLADLLTGALSGVLTLFRATLRLYGEQVPSEKFQALEKLNAHVAVNVDCFQTLEKLKTGGLKPKEIDTVQLFDDLLKSLETAVDAVNEL